MLLGFVSKCVRSTPFMSALALATFLTAGSARAQSADGKAAIAGSVQDPDAKAVVGAVVMSRNEQSGDMQTTTTDGRGHFTFAVQPGTYTLEVVVPGFEIVRRNGVQTTGTGNAEEITVKLSIANISESVTVSVALPAAAVAAPSQGSLTARSAQSLISNEYIRNYTSPVSDYSQVLQMAPGTFSVSANGPGLGDTKTFFRGFKDGYYSMTFDGDAVQRHERSDAPFLGLLSGADHRFDGVRSQPGIGLVDRALDLWRIGQLSVAGAQLRSSESTAPFRTAHSTPGCSTSGSNQESSATARCG